MTTRFLLAVAAVLVPACTDDDDVIVVVDDPVGDTVEAGQARGAVVASTAFDELIRDEYFVILGKTAGILTAIHDGVINHAALGEQIVGFDDIFDFAGRLIVDHDNADLQLDAVVRFYGINYIPSQAQLQVTRDAQLLIGELRATPPTDVDFVFTEHQVLLHSEAQVVLDELAILVGDSEMGDYIEETRLMIDDHLAEAEDLLGTFF